MLLEASRISETVLKQTNSNSNKMGITAEAQALVEILGKYASIPESQEIEGPEEKTSVSLNSTPWCCSLMRGMGPSSGANYPLCCGVEGVCLPKHRDLRDRMMWEVVVGLYVGPTLMGIAPSEGIRRLQSLSGIQIPRVIAPSSNACHICYEVFTSSNAKASSMPLRLHNFKLNTYLFSKLSLLQAFNVFQ